MPATKTPPSGLMTVAEAAEMLDMPERWVRGMVARKQIPHKRRGYWLRFDPEALRRWDEANTFEPDDAA